MWGRICQARRLKAVRRANAVGNRAILNDHCAEEVQVTAAQKVLGGQIGLEDSRPTLN